MRAKRQSANAFARVLERIFVIPKTPSERLKILGPARGVRVQSPPRRLGQLQPRL